MSPTSPSPRIPRSSTPLYSSSHSRSKSHLPHPKVLPFPDLPVRSRPTSPAGSPGPSRYHESEHLRDAGRLSVESGMMVGSGSSDGERGFGSSMSPPIYSPLTLGSESTPHFVLSPAPRNRSQTSPAWGISRPGSRVPSPLPTSVLPARTEGFHPTPLSAPITTVSPPRPSSIPVAATTSSKPRSPPVKKRSDPPVTPPATIAITPSSSTDPLNNHLYQSFLKGSCADVRLWVRKWGIGWHVHRVVLVQAGFFHSLFLGGFSETSGVKRQSTSKGKEKATSPDDEDDWQGEDVELQFDDPNITRAGFEICLSRLYSPYPQLRFPMNLFPTAYNPFTLSYSPSSSTSNPSLRSTHQTMPLNTHLATPRLLLSILTTAIYLGQSPLMREVLTIILRTVSPVTVGRYLGFAIGDGIGEEEWDDQDEAGARGLEPIGRTVKPRKDSAISEAESDGVAEGANGKVGGPAMVTRAISETSTSTLRGNPRLGLALTTGQQDEAPTSNDPEHLPHFYGFASNEIGEACICYLARWGTDILSHELVHPASPPIFGHRGLHAKFVGALLGSDLFWVKGEMERYSIARQILNTRRKGWEAEVEGRGDVSAGADDEDGDEEWDEDEMELGKVFAEGIHYAHMTFDDLSIIAKDIDPTTSLPYAPLPVLQAAHWAAADLRSRVLAHGGIGDQLPVNEENAELGLTQTTSDIRTALNRGRRGLPRSRMASSASSAIASDVSGSPSSSNSVYYPIPSDDTHGIGAAGLLSTSSSGHELSNIPDLGPDSSFHPTETSTRSKTRPPPQSEKTCFGLLSGSRSLPDLTKLNIPDETRWTKLPPFRFSVEFWNLDKLVEKERAYSDTHFYAGSWFNVYVQTIRKKDKGAQLGIYLHRQSPGEPFPTPSSPKRRDEREGREGTGPPVPLVRAMSTHPVAVGSPLVSPRGAEQGVKGEIGPYMDPRRITKAYFSISCASALGTALIRFTSSPDSFTVSQSWGWKSSALRSEEYLSGSGGEKLEDGVLGWVGEESSGERREGSLRATVVVGVI